MKKPKMKNQKMKFPGRFVFANAAENPAVVPPVASEAPPARQIPPEKQQALVSVQNGLAERQSLLVDAASKLAPDAVHRLEQKFSPTRPQGEFPPSAPDSSPRSNLNTSSPNPTVVPPTAPSSQPPASPPSPPAKAEKSIFNDLLKIPGVGAMLISFAQKIEEWGLGDVMRMIGFEKYFPKPTPSQKTPTEAPAAAPNAAAEIAPANTPKGLLAQFAKLYGNRKLNLGDLNLNSNGVYNPAEREGIKAVCDIIGITEKINSAEELFVTLSNSGAQIQEDLNAAKDMQPGDVVFLKMTSAKGEFQLANAGVITATSPELKVRILQTGQTQTTEVPFERLKEHFFSFVKLPQKLKNA